ncbi:MAG: transcription repressor NadR [Firmicutes bacterium]|nr:transcription repressor NadR [Bacillota bacterium]
MKAGERRKKLISMLKNSSEPIIGSDLAEKFAVSRQVIVQDIALLRAEGEKILATSQGYLIPGNQLNTIKRTIACRHDNEEVEDELMTIVSHGAKVNDVIVEHPIYGEIRGILMIQSPFDVEKFMLKYREKEAALLASLTDGVHLHTIEAINESVIKRLKNELRVKGYLLEQD